MPSAAALPAAPTRPYEPRGADITREKLLQATNELLFERAGAEPTVSEICERAGVQQAMVSYCFGGKAQLLEALVRRIAQAVTAEIDELATQDLEPETMLRHHVAAMVRNFVRFPYVTQLSERLKAGSSVAVEMATLFAEPLTRFYEQLLGRGARDGAFRTIEPTFFTFSIVGMCEYLFAARSMLPWELDDERIEQFTEHTVDLLLHGIAR